MSSEDNTGRVAATVIPQTQENEKFLVAWRTDLEKWEFPGGKEDSNQDRSILETAEREIEEELGVKIEAVEYSEERSFQSGKFEIVPVKASHGYEDLDQHLELKEEKHGRYSWIKPGEHDLELGEEARCLEAFMP